MLQGSHMHPHFSSFFCTAEEELLEKHLIILLYLWWVSLVD